MKGAYLRAAFKAEIKRAKARGDKAVRGKFFRDECGLTADDDIMPEFDRARRELESPAIEKHGPPYPLKRQSRRR